MRIQPRARRVIAGLLLSGGILFPGGALRAQPPPAVAQPAVDDEEPWLEPIPVPFDPELEHQIEEVQDALSAINKQLVRHKEQLKHEEDPAAKAKVYDTLEAFREEREDLEAVLNDLVEEAKASQRTVIDEALARARWLERQQEQWYQKEELTRDRKE